MTEHSTAGHTLPEPIPEAAPAVRYDGYGGIEVLRVESVPVATPSVGELLIEVRAAGINPGEAAIREGMLAEQFPSTFPSGQGTDLAGVVAEVSEAVTEFVIGDEVIGWSEERSSQAAYVVIPAGQAIRKPPEIEWNVAGGLFVVGVTAYAAVRAIDARPGDTVVVSAAGGGVGSLVVQLLRLAEVTVIAIASEADHDWLFSKGATPVAYGDGLLARVQAAAPNGVDALIDTYGPVYIDLAIELGIDPSRIETIIAFEAAQKVGALAEGSAQASTVEVLSEMAANIASGRVELRLARSFPLHDVAAAFDHLEHGHPRGKIVLVP